MQDYSKNRKSSQQIQQEADTKYDVGGISSRLSSMRSLVGNLENSIENVDPSVRGRSAGGFVTEGQNQALINRERTPLLGSLAKQQSAMGDTQQQFGLASTLAGQLAQNMRSDDETGYQRLLDQYNAATAQEQATEAKRQYEENLKLEREKQAQAQAAAAKASSGYDLSSILGGGNTGGGQPATPTQTPENQRAYNDVKNLLSKDSKRIQQEYNAIRASAGFGNAYDKIKLALIEQLRPEVKSFGKNTVSLSSNLAGSTVTLGGDPYAGGLSVGNASPGTIR